MVIPFPVGHSEDDRTPTTMVLFKVREASQVVEFLVHKEVACYHSIVFDGAFNGGFRETETLEYELDDTTPRAFQLLVQWLYSQRLELQQLRPNHKALKLSTEDRSENMALVELWVLADRLLVPRLQNHVIEYMYKVFVRTQFIPAQTWKFIFGTDVSVHSPLRQYAIDLAACFVDEETYDELEESDLLPTGLLVGVAKIWAKQRFSKGTKGFMGAYLEPKDYYVPLHE